MKIGHVALYVNDVERAKAFFVKYFGAAAGDKYCNAATGFCSYFLSFPDNGAKLEVMTKPGMYDAEKPASRTGFAHIAFCVGSREKVDALTFALEADGFRVASGPRFTGDGYYESCVLDAEGNQIEITV